MFGGSVGAAAAGSTSVQRPSSMGANLLKRPSSILLGMNSPSPNGMPSSTTGSGTSSICMSISPKQQMISKEVIRLKLLETLENGIFGPLKFE